MNNTYKRESNSNQAWKQKHHEMWLQPTRRRGQTSGDNY